MRSTDSPIRALALPLGLLALQAVTLRALFAADALGHVLGAATAPSPWVVSAMVAFYLLRLVVVFVVPGWIVIVTVRLVLARARGSL